MAASLSDILASLQNGVQAINALSAQLREAFPPITDLSTSVLPTGGTLSFVSSQAQAFGLVQTSSGGSYRIALYPSS